MITSFRATIYDTEFTSFLLIFQLLHGSYLSMRVVPLLTALQIGAVNSWAVGALSPVDALAADALIARWSSGANHTDGLKGGIAWALDPALCDALVPLFPEAQGFQDGFFGFFKVAHPSTKPFLSCAILKGALRMAMRSWEAANSNIRFFEVTSLCESNWVSNSAVTEPPGVSPTAPPVPNLPPLPPASPPPEPPLAPGTAANSLPPPPPPPLSEGASTLCDGTSLSCITCPHAELIISGFRASGAAPLPSQRLDGSGAARAQLTLQPQEEPPLVATSDFQPGAWLNGDVSSGQWIDGFAPTGVATGRAIHSAVLQLDVSEDRCWFYDDDFCEVSAPRHPATAPGLSTAPPPGLLPIQWPCGAPRLLLEVMAPFALALPTGSASLRISPRQPSTSTHSMSLCLS